jgi:hypothetical protein
MRLGRLERAIVAASSLFLVHARAREVRAEGDSACLSAYDKAQRLRQDRKLLESRAELVVCVAPECPGIVKRDCSQWLAELDALTPTVVVRARNADGRDVVAIRVLVDGVPWADRLDGIPRPLNPGFHIFRYEPEGRTPFEEPIVVQEGEKNRVIVVKQAPLPPVAPTGGDKTPADKTPAEATSSRSPLVGYVLIGAGVAGAVGFGVLASSGQRDLDRMRPPNQGACAPNCDQGKVDAAVRKIIVGDALLGAGIIAAGIGTYLLVRPQRADKQKIEVGIGPSVGGVHTSVGYLF